MAGVAGPLTRDGVAGRADARWFLAGLLLGELLTAVVVALVLVTISSGLTQWLIDSIRIGVVAAAGLVLGALDVLDRTPHIWRQVPQRFVHILQPFPRGLIWGIDLGSFISTQKTTSLLWFGLVGAVFLSSSALVPAICLGAILAVAMVAVLSFAHIIPKPGSRRSLRVVRWMSGLLIMGVSTGLVLTSFAA